FESSSTGYNTSVNHLFEETFGYSSEELKNNGWKILVHPDDAEDYFTAWASVIKDLRPFRYTARFVTKTGVVLTVFVNAAPSVQSNVTVWMGTVRIGNERKHHES